MINKNLGTQLQVLNILPIAAVIATANGTGVDLKTLEGELAFVIDVSAPVAGTSPTLDLTLEESDDNSSFAAVSGGAFTQVTSAASVQKLALQKSSLKRYVRVVKTIGGTDSPQYLVSVKAYGIKKINA